MVQTTSVPAPVVQLSAPSKIGSCDSLILDASSSLNALGSAFVASWSVGQSEGLSEGAYATLLTKVQGLKRARRDPFLVAQGWRYVRL